MKNLLRADFSRLIKNKFIWISWLSVVVLAFFEAYRDATDNIKIKGMSHYFYMLHKDCAEYGRVSILNTIFSVEAQFIVFLILAVFVSLYIGGEFFSGAIKNKSLKGYGKVKVYLSCLIVSSVYALILSVFFIVGAWIAVQVFVDENKIGDLPTKFILKTTPFYVCAVIAVACMLVLVCLVIKERKKAVLVSVIVVLVLIAINIFTMYILSEWEFNYVLDYENNTAQIVKNPEYPSDTTLTVCSFLSRLNPVCQTRGYLHYMWAQIEHTCYDPLYTHKDLANYMPDVAFYPLYSLAWVAICAVGCVVLSKKDDLF